MPRLDIVTEPTDRVYTELLRYATSRCDAALVIVRPTLGLGTRGSQFLSRAREHLRDQQLTSEWPGTILMGDRAVQYRYGFSEPFARLLLSETSGLFEWRQPQLPEDLCLLREDGSPWLVTISHERDAWLDIETREIDSLRQAVEGLNVVPNRTCQ